MYCSGVKYFSEFLKRNNTQGYIKALQALIRKIAITMASTCIAHQRHQWLLKFLAVQQSIQEVLLNGTLALPDKESSFNPLRGWKDVKPLIPELHSGLLTLKPFRL
jgi:hypothetical protein